MSDHPKEADRELKRIVICADICLAVFRWLPRAKVGLELALVSCRFDALVDAHLRSRRWTLGILEIVKSTTNGEARIVKIDGNESSESLENESFGSLKNGPPETLSIPQTPLPNGVVGFARIKFRYATDDSIAFLRRIGRLFQSDITLELFAVIGDDLFPNLIWPLLNPSAGIVKMHFDCEEVFQDLRRHISPSVLRDCANLRVVHVHFGDGFDLQFPPEDNAGASDRQSLCKWLHTPLRDGRPKVFKTYYLGYTTISQLHKEFRSATTGVSFIIITSTVGACFVFPFEVENSMTNERLTMRSIENNADYRLMVVRSPIGQNADQWAEWEREALEEDGIGWKVLEFGDRSDPLMLYVDYLIMRWML